jgi:hypothetical protein
MRPFEWRDLAAAALLGGCLSAGTALAQDIHPSNTPATPGAAAPSVPSPPALDATTLAAPAGNPSVVFVEPGGGRRGVYVRAETIFLDRNTPDVILSQTTGADPNRPLGLAVMSGEDVNFDMQSGVRLTLGYQYDDRHALEGTFTGFLDWNAKAQATGFLDLDAGVPGIFPLFCDASLQTADYSSTLNMVEANHITRIGTRGTFLVGVRYVDLEEDLHRLSVVFPGFPGLQGEFDVKTRNYMFGPQVGGSWRADLTQFLSFDATGKAGFLGNFYDVGTNIADSLALTYANDQEQEVDIATVWDLGANLRWQLSDRLAVHGGYQVLVIQGAALAIEQSYDSTETGNIVYHGPNVGLTWQR